MLWENNIPLLQTGTEGTKSTNNFKEQMNVLISWLYTPFIPQRCKCHWQQCPLEYQYSRIRRSLKQMTFPILFHSFFWTWHLFSHVYIHIKAANSNSLCRHISVMGWKRPFLQRKGHQDLKPQTFSCFQMPQTAAVMWHSLTAGLADSSHSFTGEKVTA